MGSPNGTIDTVQPSGAWEFDAEVTKAFDNMLARSVPNYECMRETTSRLALPFLTGGEEDKVVVDLGASRGQAIKYLQQLIAKSPQIDHGKICFTACDVSEPMREAMEQDWPQTEIDRSHRVKIQATDLRHDYPVLGWPADVTLCVLTLQFTPIEYRQQILHRIWRNTREGGALIFVEKVLGSDSQMQELLVDTYHDLKRQNGYTEEQVQSKRESLEGVLVPVTAQMNEDLLASAGFRSIDCVWRTLNFAAWLAVR